VRLLIKSKIKILLCPLLVLLCVTGGGCSKRSLRGTTTASPDGKTYLSVDDDNGGKCGPLTVDGSPWLHKIGQPGAIEPGAHKIQCGGWIGFKIPSGVVFHFDYWGP
jgi:hypothetical protein